MCLVVGLRTWVRLRLVKSLGVDDCILYLSAATAIIYVALALEQTRLGLGLPVRLRPKPDVREYGAVNYACRPIYNVSIAAFKIALCFTYLRIIGNSSLREYRLAIWSAIIYTVLVHLITILLVLLACEPVSKGWIPMTPGKCLSTNPLYYGTAAFTISCDVIVFILPVPLVYGLHMERKKRYGLIFAFVLGLFTTICSIMRLLQVPAVAKGGDPTNLILWAIIETDVGIITSSIPSLAPLLKIAHGKFQSDNSKNPYNAQPERDSQGSFPLQSFRKSYGNGPKKEKVPDWGTDHGSEENILSGAKAQVLGAVPPGQISKTTNFEVSRLPVTR
ncbi:hypothetical protein MBLNU459_g5247t1 [Dothideomycetes sp. NU459]